jgi:hypothetical protein
LRPNQEKVRSTTQQRGTPYDRQRCSGSIKREAIYTASEDPRYIQAQLALLPDAQGGDEVPKP